MSLGTVEGTLGARREELGRGGGEVERLRLLTGAFGFEASASGAASTFFSGDGARFLGTSGWWGLVRVHRREQQ